jgi:hypothetical protein
MNGMAHYHDPPRPASMAPVPSSEEDALPPGLVLAAELQRPGRSTRWLAVQLAGEGADHSTIETRRRYLQKVVGNPDWRPTPPLAERLASALEIPASLLLRPRPPRRRPAADELAGRLEVLVARGSEVADRLEALLAAREDRQDAESAPPPSR